MKKLVVVFSLVSILSFGQSKCYLEYHMTKGFATYPFCWGSDTDKFYNTLSYEAKHFLDSVFNSIGANPKNIVCKKLTLKEGENEVKAEKIANTKYYYSVFERTFDCFDSHHYRNFKGKVKVNMNTKVFLEYFLGVKGDYEALRIYIINDKKPLTLL